MIIVSKLYATVPEVSNSTPPPTVYCHACRSAERLIPNTTQWEPCTIAWYTSVLAQEPYLYSAPTGGSSNRPATVVSSATSLAWIKNPRNVGAATVDSRTTAKYV